MKPRWSTSSLLTSKDMNHRTRERHRPPSGCQHSRLIRFFLGGVRLSILPVLSHTQGVVFPLICESSNAPGGSKEHFFRKATRLRLPSTQRPISFKLAAATPPR